MRPGASGAPEAHASPIQVLHVDDDAATLDLARTMLAREDPAISVTAVSGAAPALDALEEGEFDCVVSDYDMPETDGLSFLEAVRERHGDLPFVLFTGKGSEEIASEAISAGVTDYLQKGGGSEQYAVLANRIENAVERYRAERAVEDTRRWHQRLVEESTDVILVVDPDGTIRYLSRSVEHVLGYDAADLTGDNAFDYIHPDDRPAAEEAHASVVAGEPGFPRVEFRCEDAAGNWITLESHSRNLVDDPTIGGVVVYVRDVSGRRARQRELARYETVVERVPEGVFVLDEEAVFVDCNETTAGMLGRERGALVGERFDELIEEGVVSEGVVESYEGAVRELLSSETDTEEAVFQYDLTLGGEARVYRVHLALRPFDEEYRGTIGIVQDVTDRKAREERLERYRRIVGAMGDGVYVLDVDGGMLEFNEFMVELTGYDRETMLGAEPSLWHDPDDIEAFERAIRELLAAEEDTVKTVEATIERADGDRVPIEANLTLLQREDGEFRGTVGVIRDVTERRERERELEQYETIIRTMPDEVYRLDTEGRIEMLNVDRATTGYDREDIVGEHASKIMPEEDIERGAEVVRELVTRADLEKATFEMDLVTRDGARIPHENHVALLPPDEGGRVPGTVGVLRDISERKEREEALARQNERLDRFARMVSHDLRNPLNVAVGRVQMECREDDSENLRRAREALGRMNDMVDDVLSLAREGERVVEADEGPFDRCVEAAWETIDAGSASLEVRGDPGALLADHSRLRRLLANLFRNAVEHAGPDVTVRVGRFEGDGEAGFFVEDDGPGIPEPERERIFEFGRSGNGGGTGFGLAIVEEIAAAHGWEVTAGGGDGDGARFEVTGVEWIGPG